MDLKNKELAKVNKTKNPKKHAAMSKNLAQTRLERAHTLIHEKKCLQAEGIIYSVRSKYPGLKQIEKLLNEIQTDCNGGKA